MSIDILIEDGVARGRLFRLLPYEPSTPIVRLVCLSDAVWPYVMSNALRAGRLHAELDSFIGGDQVTISLNPRGAKRGAKNAFIGMLEPSSDGFLDIRSRDPRPALRVLGGFARRDYFIGLVLRERRLMETEQHWEEALTECKRSWWHLFYPIPPITGASPNDYLSNWICLDTQS